MSWMFAVVGLAIVVFTLFDLIITTLTMEGAGPASNPVSHLNWKCFRKADQVLDSLWLRMMTGPVTLVVLVVFWMACTWSGWVLVFSWDGIPVVNAETGQSASLIERVYYIGYTITTVGYGDFRALGTPGRIASVLAGFNGLFLLTLAITYSIQVLTAVVEKRRLALLLSTITVIHKDPSGSAGQSKQRMDFTASQLAGLHIEIAGVSQKYLAYPVIHAFYDRSARVCLPLNIQHLHTFLTRSLGKSADIHQELSVVTEQLQATRLLVRVLVINAMSRHWSSVIHDKSVRNRLPGDDDIFDEDIHQQPLDTVLMAFVETSGWGSEQ